jgi:hypothetical protein
MIKSFIRHINILKSFGKILAHCILKKNKIDY